MEQQLENGLQSVIFKLDKELYCIDIFRVNEIIKMREITPIPKSEPHIKGLVNLRGKTIPVIDLKLRMNMGNTVESDDTRIVVVDSDQGNIGMMVDSVQEVATLQGDQIESSPALVSDADHEYVWGVAKQDERIITILNLDKTLTIKAD